MGEEERKDSQTPAPNDVRDTAAIFNWVIPFVSVPYHPFIISFPPSLLSTITVLSCSTCGDQVNRK